MMTTTNELFSCSNVNYNRRFKDEFYKGSQFTLGMRSNCSPNSKPDKMVVPGAEAAKLNGIRAT